MTLLNSQTGGHCWLHDDPHFTTFDGTHYDWHGRCNYSLAQTDQSYEPHTAVYASFKRCFPRKRFDKLPSCVDKATFRENPHTVVEMNAGNPSEVMVVVAAVVLVIMVEGKGGDE